MRKQTLRQAARVAASGVQAERRRERADRDRRLETLPVDVLTALGERDETITGTERRAGDALEAMIDGEGLSATEAAQWCAGQISTREVTRLRRLATVADVPAVQTAGGGTAHAVRASQ